MLLQTLKFLNDGGNVCLLELLLLPIAVWRVVALSGATKRGQATSWTSWLAMPLGLAALGAIGMGLKVWQAERSWGFLDPDGPWSARIIAALVLNHAGNPGILGLGGAMVLLLASALLVGRLRPGAPPNLGSAPGEPPLTFATVLGALAVAAAGGVGMLVLRAEALNARVAFIGVIEGDADVEAWMVDAFARYQLARPLVALGMVVAVGVALRAALAAWRSNDVPTRRDLRRAGMLVSTVAIAWGAAMQPGARQRALVERLPIPAWPASETSVPPR